MEAISQVVPISVIQVPTFEMVIATHIILKTGDLKGVVNEDEFND